MTGPLTTPTTVTNTRAQSSLTKLPGVHDTRYKVRLDRGASSFRRYGSGSEIVVRRQLRRIHFAAATSAAGNMDVGKCGPLGTVGRAGSGCIGS